MAISPHQGRQTLTFLFRLMLLFQMPLLETSFTEPSLWKDAVWNPCSRWLKPRCST